MQGSLEIKLTPACGAYGSESGELSKDFVDTGHSRGDTRMTRMELTDRFKALCGAVLGKKASSLIFYPTALHIGHDALHRDPSPGEGPFSDPIVSKGKHISLFSVCHA